MSILGKSYGWGTHKPATKEEALAMAAKGRREITPGVFGSRPGAPLASQDRIGALGVGGEVGTSDRRGNWDSFFRQHAPTRDELARSASRSAPLGADAIAADEAFGGGTTPIPTTPDQHIAAAIADHTKWLGQQGIAFPPPPTASTSPNAANVVTFPNMANDPARFKSQFVTTGGVDPGYASRVMAFNKDLYAPADTRVTPATPAAAPLQAGWKNWQAPTPQYAANVADKYSTRKIAMNDWLKEAPL